MENLIKEALQAAKETVEEQTFPTGARCFFHC